MCVLSARADAGFALQSQSSSVSVQAQLLKAAFGSVLISQTSTVARLYYCTTPEDLTLLRPIQSVVGCVAQLLNAAPIEQAQCGQLQYNIQPKW